MTHFPPLCIIGTNVGIAILIILANNYYYKHKTRSITGFYNFSLLQLIILCWAVVNSYFILNR